MTVTGDFNLAPEQRVHKEMNVTNKVRELLEEAPVERILDLRDVVVKIWGSFHSKLYNPLDWPTKNVGVPKAASMFKVQSCLSPVVCIYCALFLHAPVVVLRAQSIFSLLSPAMKLAFGEPHWTIHGAFAWFRVTRGSG